MLKPIKKKRSKWIAFSVMVIMLLDSFSMSVYASQLTESLPIKVQEYSTDYIYENNAATGSDTVVIENSGTTDGGMVSDGDGGTSDGEDAITGDNSTVFADTNEKALASGTYYGMDWVITKDFELKISGMYDENEEGSSWHQYASSITSAQVTALNVRSTRDWFRNLTNLKSVNFAGFDSGGVRNMNGMFYMCTALEEIKWSNAKTHNVTDMGFMFYGCRKLETLDVSMFNTGKVTNMRYMFGGCSALTQLAVGGFTTSRVTDMTGMFQNCSNVGRLNVSNFNTERVTNMSYLFADCYSLKTLDVSGFDTSAVTNFSSMFQNCSMLTSLNLNGFKTDNAKHMSAMFYGCNSLTALDLSNFETTHVTNLNHMFSDCRELEEIKFGKFSTVYVTDVDYMFYKCYKLKKLDLSSFNLLRVKKAENMLARCGALEELKTPTSLKAAIALPFTMQDEKGRRYSMLPQNQYSTIVLQHVPYGIELIDDQVYTGKAIKPEVVVVKDGETLKRGVDYKVTYKNNTNVADAGDAKAPTVIVNGIGRFSGSFTGKFSIVAREITEENTTVGSMIVKADNKVKTLRPSVTVDGRKLTFNKDYVVEYPDNTEGAYKEPGRYNVIIRGKCNYSGVYSTTMMILGDEQHSVSELTIEKIPACVYQDGLPVTPSPKVTYKGSILNLDEDYSLTYKNNVLPGKATLIITGLENTEGTFVSGTIKKTFTIKGKPLSSTVISYSKTAEYTGFEIYPEVIVMDGDKVLSPTADYTIEYDNNINVGKGKIILKGCGGYTGTVKKTFAIQPEVGVGDLLDIFVGDDSVAEYTRDGVKPKVTVKLDNLILQQGVDYRVNYHNNKMVAKANDKYAPTVVITGIGNYRFVRKETFTIKAKSLGDGDISITVSDRVAGTSNLRSKPVIKDGQGKTLKQGEDYTIVGYKIGGVDYDPKNIPADATTAIVTVKGKGGYTGELSKMYRITEKSINRTNVVAKSLVYNGSSVEYTPDLIALGMLVITDKKTNAELEYGIDYEIIGYVNNNRRGTATVIIRGLGDYGGIKNINFRIVTKKIPF